MKVIVYILPFDINYAPDKLRQFEWDAPGPGEMEAREQAFREFNVVQEGDPHIARQCRSMSVGDVIEIGEKKYVCAHCGWKEISQEDFDRLSKVSFRDRDLWLYQERDKEEAAKEEAEPEAPPRQIMRNDVVYHYVGKIEGYTVYKSDGLHYISSGNLIIRSEYMDDIVSKGFSSRRKPPVKSEKAAKPEKIKYKDWTLIDWDGNPELGLKCWRKSFRRGHVSIGAGVFRSIVYSYGANSEDSLSGTRARLDKPEQTEDEAKAMVDRNGGLYNHEDND